MMCLIKIVDGQPFEHPMLIDNYLQAYPNTDLQNLPAGLAWFERKLRPELPEGSMFVDEQSVYEFDGTVWTDVWRIRDKTDAEKAADEQHRVELYHKYAQTIKSYFEEELAKCTTEANSAIVQNILDAINATLADATGTLTLPPLPKKDKDGNWSTINTSGSAPNVIS